MKNIQEAMLEGGSSTQKKEFFDQRFKIQDWREEGKVIADGLRDDTKTKLNERNFQGVQKDFLDAPIKFQKVDLNDEYNLGTNHEDFENDRQNYYKSRYIHEMKVQKPQAKKDTQKVPAVDEEAPQKEENEEDDADGDRVQQELKMREQEYVKACLELEHTQKLVKPHRNEKEDKDNLVVIEHLLYNLQNKKESETNKLDHCYAKKICDKTQDSMLLQIIKDDMVVFQDTIQKTYHLFGLAKLAINPDYISTMQNGNILYYFKQVIEDVEDADGKTTKSKFARLMQIDLSQDGELISQQVLQDVVVKKKQEQSEEEPEVAAETERRPVQVDVIDSPKHKDYKGTLVGMIILPSYEQTNTFNKSKDQADSTAFLKENYVLFLYKSNKTPKYSEEYTSAGDNFTIYNMNDLSKPLYDSVENKLVFSQEIQALSPIFLKIDPKNFEYNGNNLESNEDIIFLSFLEPDDDDDVEGLFNTAHRDCFQAIAKKTGRDLFQVLKIKKSSGDIDIIGIENDENKKMDQKQLKAQNEQITDTLEKWADHIKEQCQLKKEKNTNHIKSCIQLDRSKSKTTRRFCQINDIIQNEDDDLQDISVVLDHQNNKVSIYESDLENNKLTHVEIDARNPLVPYYKAINDKSKAFNSDYHFMNIKERAYGDDKSKNPNQLQFLNKLLFLTNSTESYKLTYNVHQKYNDVLAYHNDLEQKIVFLESADDLNIQKQMSYSADTKSGLIKVNDPDFELMKYFSSNVVTHKSLGFLDIDKPAIKQEMEGKVFVGMNIQIRKGDSGPSALQSKATLTKFKANFQSKHANEEKKSVYDKFRQKMHFDKFLDQKKYYFKMVPRGDQDPANFQAISPTPCQDDQPVPFDADALIIVPEKVTYANDDRSIRPFLLIKTDDRDYTQVSKVRKLWVAMIDIKTSQVVHYGEQRLQGEIYVNYKTVQKNFKLVMSSNIYYGKRDKNNYLEQKYQLYIKYDDIDYAIIKEYRMRWTPNEEGHEHKFTAWSRLIGQKFVATNEDYSLQKSELFPLFTSDGDIIGTQIFTGQDKDSHIIEIPNLKQSQTRYHKQYQNHSNYRRFPLKNNVELVIFEVGLSNLMLGHLWQRKSIAKNSYFSSYDLNEILDNGLKIIMNLVPLDFMGLVARDNIQNYPYMGYNLVTPLEILDGETIISMTIKEPQVLEALIASKDQSFDVQTFTMSFIERLANNDAQKEFLQKYQFLYDRAAPEASMGIDQVPLLRKVLINKEPTQIRMIAENLFEQGDLHRYEFLMGSLYEAQESKNFQYFYPFFNCGGGEQGLEFDRKVNDPRFKYFSDKKRNVITYHNSAADFEQNEIIEKIIYEERNQDKYEYEVEHSFIDLRPMLLDQKFQALIGKEFDEDMQIRMNEFEIANLINKIIDDNFPEGEIDNQKIMRVIITHQFNTYSRKYYNYLCIGYLLGYFLPLMAQIIIELPDFGMVIAAFIFFMTHCTLFYIETIQMRSQNLKDYLTNWVNIVECMSFFVSIYFTYMKLLDPANRYFANHSEVFKITEESDQGIQTKMIMAGGFLVTMSMFKLLSLLKSFDNFGNFVYLVIKCVKQSVVFCIFLGAWVFIFTMLLMVIGCRFDDEDYPSLSLRDMTLIQVYRNSIGDIGAPKYDLWYNPDLYAGEQKGYYGGKIGKFMVGLIWTIWFLNQFFCMVMLMNFLIAIISDEYAQIATFQTHYTFMRRKELNFDCLCVYNFFNQLEDFNTLIVWSDPETGGALSGNKDVASNIKQFITEKNDKLQNQLMDNMRNQSVELQQSVDGINQEIDEVKKSQSGGKDKILEASRQKLQNEVSDIIKDNENDIQNKFGEVETKITSLSSQLEQGGQGSQGIQEEVESVQKEIRKNLGVRIEKITADVKDQIKTKGKLSQKVQDKQKELQDEITNNSKLQTESKGEIEEVQKKIKDQEAALNTVKGSVKEQADKVDSVLTQISEIRKELTAKLPNEQDKNLDDMSKAVQDTLKANLTAILTEVTKAKQSIQAELDAEKKAKQELEKEKDEAVDLLEKEKTLKDAVKKAVESMEKEKDDALEAVEKAKNEAKESQEKLEGNAKELAEAQDKIKDLEEKLAKAQEQSAEE